MPRVQVYVCISPNHLHPSGCLAARGGRGAVLCLVRVVGGFQDVGISRTRHHLLTVTVHGGAHLWGPVTRLPWSGLQSGSREWQVHHIEHVAQASGHLRRKESINRNHLIKYRIGC